MTNYYAKKLSGERLQQCYRLASPRVQQYLEAEIQHVLSRLSPNDSVLELGCGYGRVTERLAEVAARVVGIDNAEDNLAMARRAPGTRCEYHLMDAMRLDFPDDEFDVVVCIQNGICAFGVDDDALLREALRVTRACGRVMFSSYADAFWPHRLAWFEAQADGGLLGPIDHDTTGDGVIACKDGFRAGHMTPEDFRLLCAHVGVGCSVEEVDGSSVFCEVVK